jgi:predicted phage baseplate assembly protein
VSGNFGKGVEIQNNQAVDDGYRPPILEKLTLGYRTAGTTTPTCLTYDDFAFTERTGKVGFVPFTRSPDPAPALYLGFDRPFAWRDTLLYVQVAPLSIEEARQEVVSSGAPPRIAWDYSTPEGWDSLGVEDETRSFARSGLLLFIGPERFTSRFELGRQLYWLRARLAEGASTVMPRLGHVLTNTVWGTHSATLTAEILGSSDGGANLAFTLSHRPVLEGQHIEVREPELPSDTDRAELERHEGPEAIQLTGQPDRPQEIWVRWREVPDFHASGPRDRHYRINRQTGEVSFGDGRHGMAPPRGVRNVRASVYQTGGGADGNRPVGAVRQLKTTVAYVDAVTNHEPAMGGADRERAELLQERGPRQLRHGGRAVTVEDFEDLALEASPAVARVKALTPVFDPIHLAEVPALPTAMQVVVLIVPFSPELPPTPSPALVQDVDAYLRQRCAPAVSLRVVGPDWVQVGTQVTLVPTSLEGVEALRARVQRALTDFLHPLTGGFTGTGWELGQLPKESDVYRMLEAVPGVDYVRTVTLNLVLPEPERATRALVFSGTHTVSIPQGRT